MNQVPHAAEEGNPFEDRTRLPVLSAPHLIATVLICLICALAIPLCSLEWVSFAVIAILIIYVALITRAPFPILLTLIPACLLCMMTSSFITGAVFLATAVGIASCALLITVSKLRYFAVLLPVAAVGISYLFISDIAVCLLALAFLPSAILLSFATEKGRGRTSAICFAIAGLLLSLIAIFAVLLWRECGSLGRTAIIEYINRLREQIVSELVLFREELLAVFAEDTTEAGKAFYDQVSQAFSDTFIRSTVVQVFNLLPAFIVVCCSIIAFVAQRLLNGLYGAVGFGCLLTLRARVFTVSLSAAILYTLTFVLMMFLSADSMVSAVVQNVCLILMPGLFVIGLMGFLALMANAKGGMRVFFALMLAFLLCCSSGGSLYILAMLGAYTIIAGAIQKKLLERVLRDGNGPHDDDGKGES